MRQAGTQAGLYGSVLPVNCTAVIVVVWQHYGCAGSMLCTYSVVRNKEPAVECHSLAVVVEIKEGREDASDQWKGAAQHSSMHHPRPFPGQESKPVWRHETLLFWKGRGVVLKAAIYF